LNPTKLNYVATKQQNCVYNTQIGSAYPWLHMSDLC
jgi:hypothetical protein